MKFLCVCEGGNCRSVSLAYVLKDFYQQAALACGIREYMKDTLVFLCDLWKPDWIVLMQPGFMEHIPKVHCHKVRVLDVGPDRWGNALHSELLEIIKPVVQQWAAAGWAL